MNATLARAISGGKTGIRYALFYAAYASILFLVRGPRPFEKLGVSLPLVVGFYFVAGVLAGAVVGALEPLCAKLWGRAVAYFLGAVPVGLLADMTLFPAKSWKFLLFNALLFALIMGSGFAVFTWFQD